MPIATITAATDKVSCKAGETVDCSFTISNQSQRRLPLSVESLPEGTTAKDWLTVIGEIERDLPESGHEQVQVRVSVPADAEPGTYAFRLRAYDRTDTEQSVESPAIAVEVPAPEVKVTPPPQPNGGFKWWIPVVIGAVVLVLIGGGIGIYFALSGKPTVPDLVAFPLTAEGSDEESAKALLEKEGLEVGTVTEEFSGQEGFVGGMVISQDPPAGTEVEKGSAVNVVIEAVSVAVPNVVGMTINDAEAAIEAQSLTLAKPEYVSSGSAPGGSVVKQDPQAGTAVLPSTPVTVTVRAERITVPSVIGQPQAQAESLLRGRNLRPGSITERRTGGTPGVVLSTSPAAGDQVDAGTRVNLIVEEKKIRVPNVVKEKQATATNTLKRLGLRPSVSLQSTGKQTPGIVYNQRPSPGAQVKSGSTVTLYVEREKRPSVLLAPALQKQILSKEAVIFSKDLGLQRSVPPAE